MQSLVGFRVFTTRCLATLAITVLCACGTSSPPIPDLICRMSTGAAEACSEVPTLAEAKIQLLESGTFELTGRYQACYRLEDVRIEGTFEAFPHENGVDLELLARRSSGGDPQAQRLERTIGLINLNTETWAGRFTDTTALIRSRGQIKDSVPSLQMSCSKI